MTLMKHPVEDNLDELEEELEKEEKLYDPKIRERVAKIPGMLDRVERLLGYPSEHEFDSYSAKSTLWRVKESQAQIAKAIMNQIDILLELDQRTTAEEVKEMFENFTREHNLDTMLVDGVDEEDPEH